MEGLEKNSDIEQEENKPETGTEDLGEGHQPERTEPLEPTEKEPAEESPDPGQEVQTEATVEGAQAEEGKQETLMEMYEESIRRVQEGEVVQGKIIQIDKEFVLVDIGYKSEGQVPIDEFMGPDGTIEAVVGDTIAFPRTRLQGLRSGMTFRGPMKKTERLKGLSPTGSRVDFRWTLAFRPFYPVLKWISDRSVTLTKWSARHSTSKCSSTIGSEAISYCRDG